MMLAEILRRAFTLAHQRPGLILLDLLWKGIWLSITAALLLAAVTLVTADLQSITWDDTSTPALNRLISVAVVREFWRGNREEIFGAVVAVLSASAGIWVFLEAFFRRKIIRDLEIKYVVAGFSPRFAGAGERGLKPATTYSLNVFLSSGIMKSSFLFSSALLITLAFLAGAATIAIVTFLSLAFFLTLLESLIRADAVELLGTDLIRVTGLVGILMSFEGMVAASFVTILVTGFLNVGSSTEALLMLAAAVAVILILSFFHSYLLLVRFSAIAIMRRNAVEI